MASSNPFYFETTKKIIVAFASIFNDMHIYNDFGDKITVPLHYAPKEKFIVYVSEAENLDAVGVNMTVPRMAFDMSGINFAPERYVNPLNKMKNGLVNDQFMYSRIPYDLTFGLYIVTKSFDDSLKIVEQIIPNFTPELNVTIKDREEFGLLTDIPITLNAASFSIDYESDFKERRSIQWELQFSVKAWYYGNIQNMDTIKKTIVNMGVGDYDRIYKQLVSEVVPATAREMDPHTIKDSEINVSPQFPPGAP